MPVYYHPGSCFKKISNYSSNELATGGIHVCVQGDYWSAPAGTCVSAAAAGRVHRAGNEKNGFGYYVVIEHQTKSNNEYVYTIYAHLSGLPVVKVDDLIQRGDTLGYVGKTGNIKNANANDVFFHFEIRVGGYWITDAKARDLLTKDPSTFDLSTLQGFNEQIEQTSKTCIACLLQPIATQSQAEPEKQTGTEPQPNTDPNTNSPTNPKPTAQVGGSHPCDSQKVAIQVTGFIHKDKPQKIAFYESDITQPTITEEEELEQTAEDKITSYDPKTRIKTPSTFFKWDKCNISGLKLALTVDKEQGGKLYLPVADKIEFNEAHDQANEHKSNMFLAFVPLAVHHFPSATNTYFQQRTAGDIVITEDPETTKEYSQRSAGHTSSLSYVNVRQGYIYLFVNDKLWRELKVEQDQTGNTHYKDIDLSAAEYRNADGSFKELKVTYKSQGICDLIDDDKEERPAVGKALEEIWVPYKLSNKSVQSHILFCEEQLSGPRINYLEKNGLIGATLIEYDEQLYLAKGDKSTADNSKTTHPFRIDFIPASTPRSTDEWRFNDPTHYARGNITTIYGETQKIDNLAKGAKTPWNHIVEGNFNRSRIDIKGNYIDQGSAPFEPDAWCNILSAQYATDQTTDQFWQKNINKTSQIDQHKKRYIPGILVPDPLNDVHRLHQLLTAAQAGDIFAYLALRSNKTKFASVGHFTYNMAPLFPEVMKGIANLDNDTRHQFNLSICDAERTYLLNRMHLWGHLLVKELQKPTTIEAFINLLSNHRPKKYAGAQSFLRNCMSVLSKAPEAFDPLANATDPGVTPGQIYVYQLACNTESKVHQALWPHIKDDEQLKVKAVCPVPQQNDNKGDGKFYAPALQAVQKWNVTEANLDELTTPNLQAFALQGEAELPALTSLISGTAKTGMSGVVSLAKILTDAVDESNKAITEYNKKRVAAIKAQIQASRLANKAQASTDAKNAAQIELDTQSAEYQAANKKVAELEAATAKQRGQVAINAQTIESVKNNSGKVFRNNMYLPGFEDIRQALDEFKDIRYVNVNPKTGGRKDYIVLGVTSKENLQAMDDFLEKFPGKNSPLRAGHLVAKFTALNEIMGITSSVAAKRAGFNQLQELFVLAIPATQENEKLIRAYIESTHHYLDLLITKLKAEVNAVRKGVQAAAANANLNTAARANNADLLEAAAAKNNAAALEELMHEAYDKHQAIPYRTKIAANFEKAFNHPVLPGVLLIFELWNIKNVTSQFQSIRESRGFLRAVSGFSSAYADAFYAYALLGEKIQILRQRTGLLNYKAILDKTFDGRIAKLLRFNGIQVRALAGGLLMAVTAAINFWDMASAMADDNPAWFGYMVSGIGSSLLVYQSFMASTALLLGIGPLGWLVIGITLMIVGGYLTAVLNRESQVEEWFKRGPFGTGGIIQAGKDAFQWCQDLFADDELKADYSYLQQPQEAIYRLISILLDYRMELTPVDKAKISAEINQLNSQSRLNEAEAATAQERLAHLRKMEHATHKLDIICNCANLISPLTDSMQVYLALYDVSEHFDDNNLPKTIGTLAWQTNMTNQQVIHIEKNSAGASFYLKDLSSWSMTHPSYTTAIIHTQQLEVRMQMQATSPHKAAGGVPRYFPAPLLRHNLQYNKARDAKPNFPASITSTKDRYQPFWSSNKLTV